MSLDYFRWVGATWTESESTCEDSWLTLPGSASLERNQRRCILDAVYAVHAMHAKKV